MRVVDPHLPGTGVGALVERSVVADYVYMYPPRQVYGPVDPERLERSITRSLERATTLDLYVHFPFCRQICAFCNLYAVVKTDLDAFEEYVDLVLREAEWYAPSAAGKPVQTLYLGGGTPSQLPPELFARLFAGLERLYGFSVADVPEVALEVAPDTVSADRLRGYVEAGINRVNLGLQTTDDHELHGIGRRHDVDLSLRAIELALEAGFANVCVDLIYGLQGQTFDSWVRSVDTVVALAPPTVCAYALTLRPHTGFDARGYTAISAPEQFAKYDYVDGALRAAGYRQETHVRWARGTAGGYLQKERHWALADILGLGAGARGYLWECDYRNGYSVRHRMGTLRRWSGSVRRDGHGRTDGFLMSDDERMRKALILGLNGLDRQRFRDLFGSDPLDRFGAALEALREAGLLEVDERALRLTAKGVRHRDVAVQGLFSEDVRRRAGAFDYDE